MTDHHNSLFSARAALFAVAIAVGGTAGGADRSLALGGGDNSDSQTGCKPGFRR
jgi:hypothetical protein